MSAGLVDSPLKLATEWFEPWLSWLSDSGICSSLFRIPLVLLQLLLFQFKGSTFSFASPFMKTCPTWPCFSRWPWPSSWPWASSLGGIFFELSVFSPRKSLILKLESLKSLTLPLVLLWGDVTGLCNSASFPSTEPSDLTEGGQVVYSDEYNSSSLFALLTLTWTSSQGWLGVASKTGLKDLCGVFWKLTGWWI